MRYERMSQASICSANAERIAPRQRRAADRGLILDDAAAGFVRARKAGGFQRLDQGGLARPRSAGDDDEAIAVHGC